MTGVVTRPTVVEARTQQERIRAVAALQRKQSLEMRTEARALTRLARAMIQRKGLPTRFEVRRCQFGDATEIQVIGELDLATVGRVISMLADVFMRPVVLVDLTRCDFLGSSGIAALLDSRRRRAVAGRGLAVFEATGQAQRVLDLCGLTRDGFSFDTEGEALQAVA